MLLCKSTQQKKGTKSTSKFIFTILFFNSCFISSFDSNFALRICFFFYCQCSLDLDFSSYWQQVNSTVGWIPSFLCWLNTSRKGGEWWGGHSVAFCLSQGENCFCSHNSHNVSPSLVCCSEVHIQRKEETLRHLPFFSFFFLMSGVLAVSKEYKLLIFYNCTRLPENHHMMGPVMCLFS